MSVCAGTGVMGVPGLYVNCVLVMVQPLGNKRSTRSLMTALYTCDYVKMNSGHCDNDYAKQRDEHE